MKEHKVFLIGGADDEFALFKEETGREGSCRLSCEVRGKVLHAEAPDFFEALCQIRALLEGEGLIPFCYGASLNVYPSGMSRDMGGGKVAYKLEMGQKSKRENLVRIFESGVDVVPASVAQQKEHFNEWLASIKV